MDNQTKVYQPNIITEAYYNISKLQADIILISTGQLYTKEFLSYQDGIVFDIKLLHQLSGSKTRIDKYIPLVKKSLVELTKKTIRIDLGNYEEVIMPWLSKYQYNKNDSIVTVFFNQKIMELYSKLESKFTLYLLMPSLALKSFYAKRLYQLLMQNKPWVKKETIIILEQFRKIFELEEKYLTYKKLNQDVLSKTISEINQYTDITVKMRTYKESRKVTELIFTYDFKTKELENHYKKNVLQKPVKEINQEENQESVLAGLQAKMNKVNARKAI